MRLHNIERHGIQLSPDEGRKLLDAAAAEGAVHGGLRGRADAGTVVEPLDDAGHP
jgi:hypothetical protein